MSKRAKYRIIEKSGFGVRTKYIVQERRFGTWGWWIDAPNLDTHLGYTRRPHFESLDDAKDYIDYLIENEPRNKIVYEK